MHTFTEFSEWRRAITVRCGLTLSRDYCAERIAALRDDTIPTTRNFIKDYGEDYRVLVISWFEQAHHEAS
jgi:hypothetical protein